MTWRRRFGVTMAMLLLSAMTGCAAFGRKVIYLPSEDRPVFLKKADPAPFDGILLSPGGYVKAFDKCAEQVLPSN